MYALWPGGCQRADVSCLHLCAQGVQPDVSIFNSMIAACAHGGEFAKARAMFDSMAEHGCQPDAVTYANLIRAYKKGGQWCARALCTQCPVSSLALCAAPGAYSGLGSC